ncbi:hypothetical protein Tco_1003195 [Tanacetum coccineum]|uniref:Uncharacterized protein n=1 Tax=Tanacetum coccineum TaxID=301880 RepID=A0ABQ5FAQ9_9ASTR
MLSVMKIPSVYITEGIRLPNDDKQLLFFLMAGLPTDRAALDEYMAVWFRCEVVQLRSTAVMFRKEVEEMVESRRLVVEHLEKVRGCPTSGWLDRLRVNHEEDLELLGVLC